jgi:hypothetical protein
LRAALGPADLPALIAASPNFAVPAWKGEADCRRALLRARSDMDGGTRDRRRVNGCNFRLG